MTEDRPGPEPREVAVALSNPAEPGRAGPVADLIAGRLGLPLRVVHVDAVAEDDPEPVARALLALIGPDTLLVAGSGRASRWSGKRSVVEHVVDGRHGLVLAVGGRARIADRAGPVLVALNGSEGAESAIVVADRLARALATDVLLCLVAPDDGDPAVTPDGARGDAAAYLESVAGPDRRSVVLRANDHIAAMTAEAERSDCPLVVLVSRGDRSVERSTISRTSSGLIDEAGCPVLVVETA
ncbi:MAG: universal stress protein [Acidimicrobiales bacterium]